MAGCRTAVRTGWQRVPAWVWVGLGFWAYALALPPREWVGLAWLTPIFWALAVEKMTSEDRRGGWCRFVVRAWGLAFVFWLIQTQWLWQPVPWSFTIWLSTAAGLAVFPTTFLSIAVLCRSRGASLIVVLPTLWIPLEWFRKFACLGGFPYAALEHTQTAWLALIQCAEFAGEGAVSGILWTGGAWVSAALVAASPHTMGRSRRFRHWPAYGLTVAAVCALPFGWWRIAQETSTAAPASSVRIALIQTLALLVTQHPRSDPHQSLEQAVRLSRALPAVDLVVWPETCVPEVFLQVDDDYRPSEWQDEPTELWQAQLEELRENSVRPYREWADICRAPLLLGTLLRHLKSAGSDSRPFNSALLVKPDGSQVQRIDKERLAPLLECDLGQPLFGCDVWSRSAYQTQPAPRLIRIRPSAVDGPDETDGIPFGVTICFEATSGPWINGLMRRMAFREEPPFALLNLSNNALPDSRQVPQMHRACLVFRAIEQRMPVLVATNAGSSVWIASSGKLLGVGQIGEPAVVIANVAHERRISLYRHWGDWLPWACLGILLSELLLTRFDRTVAR